MPRVISVSEFIDPDYSWIAYCFRESECFLDDQIDTGTGDFDTDVIGNAGNDGTVQFIKSCRGFHILFLVGVVLIIVPIVQAKKASPQPQATYNQSFNDALSPSADATYNQIPNATFNQSTGATYNQDTTNIQGPENFQ